MSALALLLAAVIVTPITTTVHVTGNSRTRQSTVLDLLPRQPPATYSDEEVAELERRVNNLEIFDSVHVERKGETIEVEVREKWTLIPSVEFSSGRTFADTYALLGLTEYNFLGSADSLSGSIYHADRGYGLEVYYFEHTFRRNRWTWGGYFDLAESEYRFDDGSGWKVTRGEIGGEVTSPSSFNDYFSMHLGGAYTREGISNQTGEAPSDSDSIRTFVGFNFNEYRWKDLVASGVKGELELGTGVLVGTRPAQPRHSADLQINAALPLAKYTVLMTRMAGSLRTRGNPDWSVLVGSLRGVRGIEDSLYRNWAQAYANVELRQAIPISERWALQGVLFADGAIFEQMNSTGGRGDAGDALSVGIGARIIPTWLAAIVGRVDLARLITPDQLWFVQLGLSQYF